jgi:hypothetical protein
MWKIIFAEGMAVIYLPVFQHSWDTIDAEFHGEPESFLFGPKSACLDREKSDLRMGLKPS